MASDEKELSIVDIIKLFFSFLGSMLKKAGLAFLHIIRFTFQQIKILLIFLVLGIAVALVISTWFKRYESDMIIKLNVSNAFTFFDITKTLTAPVIDGKTVAERLNISDSIAKSIVSIKPHFIIDDFDNGTPDRIDKKDKFKETADGNAVRMADRLDIVVKTKHVDAFPMIQQGILHFYANQEELKKEKEMQLNQQRQALNTIQKEIDRLDSLSNYAYFKDFNSPTLMVDSQAILLGEKPKQLYYRDITRLSGQRDSIERKIVVDSNVAQMTKPFTASRPANDYPKMIVIYGFLGILVGYIVALLIRYKKEIKTFLES